jgi:hypothetical protein
MEPVNAYPSVIRPSTASGQNHPVVHLRTGGRSGVVRYSATALGCKPVIGRSGGPG